MSELVYELVSTQFARNLNALKSCMNKAQEFAESNKFDVNCFVDIKLAPDMFNSTGHESLRSQAFYRQKTSCLHL